VVEPREFDGKWSAHCTLSVALPCGLINFGGAETTGSLAWTVFGWKRQRVDGVLQHRQKRSVDDLRIFGWLEPTMLVMSTVVIRRNLVYFSPARCTNLLVNLTLGYRL